MAYIQKTETIYFNKCEECPYFERRYTGPDGFGVGDTHNAPFCTKGYFGKQDGDFFGKPLYSTDINVPQTIPVYCEFSDKKWNINDKFIKLAQELTNEELCDLADYVRENIDNKQKLLQQTLNQKEDKVNQKESKIKQEKYKEYIKMVKNVTQELGIEVNLDQF